jgi:hypothetical protein
VVKQSQLRAEKRKTPQSKSKKIVIDGRKMAIVQVFDTPKFIKSVVHLKTKR